MFPAPQDVAPVEVTRWSARLVDDQCERDYRLSRFADDRRRLQFVLFFVGVTTILNLAGDLYAVRSSGIDLGWGLVPQISLAIAIMIALPLAFLVKSWRSLERLAIALAVTGSTAALALLNLHPRLGAIWPTLMVGILIIIYFCLPLRLTTMVVLATGYTLIAPLTWTISVAPVPPPDDIYRTVLRVVLANVLGFSVANTLQRSQRIQFAQNQLLQHLLSTDSLTGIFNRRHFDQALHDEWRRCARARVPLSLLMIDVDYFKDYNDRLGHLQGDDCLRRIAVLFTQVGRRGGDLVARYGGEEFVCLLPNTGADGALSVAERLQAIINHARIPHPASPVGPCLTISIGVASAYPPAESPEALVDLADRLLYATKKQGRKGIMSGQLGAFAHVPPTSAGAVQGGAEQTRVA